MINWLVDNGYDNDFGARPLERLIQKEIMKKIANKIIENKLENKKKTIHLSINVDEKNQIIIE